jgi:undecaprenyl-diphosphatase
MRSFVRAGWQKSDWWLVALLAASLAMVYLFAGMSSQVTQGDFREIDVAFRNFALKHREPVWMAMLSALSWLAQKPILVTIAALGAWFVSRNLLLVGLVFACGFATQELVSGLKNVFGAIRPATGMLERTSLSFPSGHVSGTAAVATLLGFASIRHKRWPWFVAPVLALITVMMAASRVFLDMHWFSDVVGGAFIGAALGLIFAILYELVTIRTTRAPWRPASASPAVADPASYSGSSYGGSAPPSGR